MAVLYYYEIKLWLIAMAIIVQFWVNNSLFQCAVYMFAFVVMKLARDAEMLTD